MLSFKVVLMLLWTFAATAVFSHAAALPSAEQWRRADEVDGNTTDVTTDDNTTNFTPRQLRNCTGPEAISSNEFVRDSGLLPAPTQSCMDLLRELQLGGRTTFLLGNATGKISQDGMCSVSFTSPDVAPADVSFDELVAPVALALARGSGSDGVTFGVLKNYRLAGICTDIRVSFGLAG